MKQVSLRPVVSGMALALFGLSAVAFTPGAGRIMVAAGTASILRDHQTLAVEKGSVIQQGDLLSTRIDGRLQWWMEDDALVAMASTSQVHIRRFEPAAGEALFTLDDGAMRVISGTSEPTVLTPLAKVSALGTDFSTFLCTSTCTRSGPKSKNPGNGKGKGDGASGQGNDLNLYVRVDEGRVRVQNSAGVVVASKGQVVYVESSVKAPVIIPKAPDIVIEVAAQLEFDAAGLDDYVPGVPIQPLPPAELPGSPS